MKRILVLGPLAMLLVLGSLLLPSSVPGRSAGERLEHGLDAGPTACAGPVPAPQEYPTEVSDAALLADIVIVGAGLWLVGGL